MILNGIIALILHFFTEFGVDDVWPRCLVESVEAELSVWAHVISCEGRMKFAKTFVHERVILSTGTASYLAL